MDQPTADAALRELEPLVGEWKVQMVPPGGEPIDADARTVFEWHDSRAHLVQRVTVDMPEAPNGVSIIGCDGTKGTYTQLYTDDRGVSRIYEMSLGGGEWRLWRDGEPFAQRFTGRFTDEGRTIRGTWELAEDGTNFRPDFDLIYRKLP